MRNINFPNDVLQFGKYQGKTIQFVIDTDREYFDWLINNAIKASDLVLNYAKGENVLSSEIKYRIKTKSDLLIIEKHSFYVLPKKKFVQKNDKIRFVNKEVLSYVKITVPFTIEKVKRSRNWHGGGMQQDDINCYSEWFEDVKIYDKDLLQEFINKTLESQQYCFIFSLHKEKN